MKRIVATCCILLVTLTVFAQNFSELSGLFQNSTVLNKHYVGFSLYDLSSKQFVYGQNEDKHFTPASNTKVFTLYTALKLIDRKSTRLNSSHVKISYAVFCLKKKK